MNGQLSSLERRQLDYRGSHGFNWLRRLWLCGASRLNRTWKGSEQMSMYGDYTLPKAESADRTETGNVEVDALHRRVADLESVLARVIDHLDPHGTSQTLRPVELRGEDD